MIKNYVSPKYGNIEYQESIWTGKKSIKVNGQTLKALSKTTYSFDHEGENVKAIVAGTIYKGSSLTIGNERYQIYAKSSWYEIVLAFIPFIFILVWGNVPALCAILPVIGGAIGGGISGALSFVSLTVMKSYDKPLLKLVTGIGFLVATITICAVLGIALVSALA
jgi:hypothetical protein